MLVITYTSTYIRKNMEIVIAKLERFYMFYPVFLFYFNQCFTMGCNLREYIPVNIGCNKKIIEI